MFFKILEDYSFCNFVWKWQFVALSSPNSILKRGCLCEWGWGRNVAPSCRARFSFNFISTIILPNLKAFAMISKLVGNKRLSFICYQQEYIILYPEFTIQGKYHISLSKKWPFRKIPSICSQHDLWKPGLQSHFPTFHSCLPFYTVDEKSQTL